jgi:hypothetical protein
MYPKVGLTLVPLPRLQWERTSRAPRWPTITMEDDVTDEDKNTQDEPVEVKHSKKENFREAVAKAVGIAVEAGSMLSGQSGELVSAERKVAESDAEKFIDRVDGED